MDCDRVFAVLTRGPFPSGDPEDPLVQQHLDGCLDCWRLAEALRPAEHLFQESVPPAESRDLPGYWGDATPPAVAVTRLAERAAAKTTVAPAVQQRAHSQAEPAPPQRTASGLDLLWIAAVIGAVSCAGLAFVLLRLWLIAS